MTAELLLGRGRIVAEETKAPTRIDTRPTATQWLECWGEIERVRAVTKDPAALPSFKNPGTGTGKPGDVRGVLLVHAAVDAYLREEGRMIYRLALKLWRDGWDWATVERDGFEVEVQVYTHALYEWQWRLLMAVRRDMARRMSLRNE